LIIILTAVGFEGLHVPYALATGLWLLAILGVVTVAQRIKVVRDGLLSS
jgi:CDP-diacylglycerol--glycerol-3-phosphate 3-phosphatidyltransferase